MPPDWLLEPLNKLMCEVAKNTLRGGIVRLTVTSELGLRLGILAGTSVRLHTAGGTLELHCEPPPPPITTYLID